MKLAIALLALSAAAQTQTPVFTPAEKPIADSIRALRKLPDPERATETKRLAAAILALPAQGRRLSLAQALANLSTEGDFGRDTLQQVTSTLEAALKAQPPADPQPFQTLAALARYESMRVAFDHPQYRAALDELAKLDRLRDNANFTLNDLSGRSWTLAQLTGKVVLVNFWATWCPPCRKEMPDLEALSREFKDKGLIVLAISDEDDAKVRPFIEKASYTFPVLLDPGRKVHDALRIEGIPKTFIYNREGRLAAQSIDMRTRAQFLSLLALAGLK